MPINDVLLEDALERREAMEQLQDEVERARWKFMRSVRRIYVDGATMREIASALGLSHQRVHQILAEAGPVDAERIETPDVLACNFCGLTQHEVGHLVAGPDAYICNACVPDVKATAVGGTPVGACHEVDDPGATCQFCGKKARRVLWMVEAPYGRGGAICNECVALVEEILTELDAD